MSNDTEDKTPEPALTTEEVEKPQDQKPVEFPDKLYCPQCRRLWAVPVLRPRANTLLTEMTLMCHRCKRKLKKMRLKDWYDHYIQGQTSQFELDTHGFLHKGPPEPKREERPKNFRSR